MPKFYIHFRTDNGTADDPEGTDLPSLEDASEAAKQSIRELIGMDLKTGRISRVAAAIIADENGRELITIPAFLALLPQARSGE